jgi:hypothetical protein
MKKISLIAALLTGVAFSAGAQTQRGTFTVGGELHYNSYESDNEETTSHELIVLPRIGYFITDNLVVGTGIGYMERKDSFDGEMNSAYSLMKALHISPFGRYYLPAGNNLKFFGQLSVPMNFGKTKGESASTWIVAPMEVNSFAVNLAPGFAFFPTANLGLEFMLSGFSYQKTTEKVDSPNDNPEQSWEAFSAGFDLLAPHLGLKLYF